MGDCRKTDSAKGSSEAPGDSLDGRMQDCVGIVEEGNSNQDDGQNAGCGDADGSSEEGIARMEMEYLSRAAVHQLPLSLTANLSAESPEASF